MRITKILPVAVGALAVVRGVNKFRHRNGNWLRNDEGVGPAHYAGTAQGNERVYKKGDVSDDAGEGGSGDQVRPRTSGEEGSTVAGRVQGSVRPG
jgi:hypothetical protein